MGQGKRKNVESDDAFCYKREKFISDDDFFHKNFFYPSLPFKSKFFEVCLLSFDNL